MTTTKKRRALHIAAIVVVALASIITVSGVLISRHYSRIIQQKLPAIVAAASDSLYHISVDAVHINFLTRRVTATGIHLYPDSARIKYLTAFGRPPKMLVKINISAMDIGGLKWDQQSPKKEIICSDININQPQVVIFLPDSARKDSLIKKPESGLQRIFAGAVNIHDPEIKIVFGTSKDAFTIACNGGFIGLKKWSMRHGEPFEPVHFIQSNDLDINLEKLQLKKPGSLYDFGIESFHFNNGRKVLLKDAYVKPAVNIDAFYETVKQQKEIYEVHLNEVQFQQLDWEELFHKHALVAESIGLNDANMSIYFSRLLPAGHQNRLGHFPQYMLQELPFPVKIPVISMERTSFRYSELNEKTKRTGNIEFSDVHGQISNFTNEPEEVEKNPDCTIRLLGKFMQRSDIAATFNFPLNSKDGAFSVSARLMNLNAGQISESAKALAMAEIKSLQMPQMDFQIAGNETASHGHFTILYNNLKIKVQRIDTTTLRMKNRPLISFVANKILLYSDNPMPNDTVRVANTYVLRDTAHSYFGMIWKNLFAAGVQTAVRNEGMLDIVKKKKASKGQPKKHFFRGLFKRRDKAETTQ